MPSAKSAKVFKLAWVRCRDDVAFKLYLKCVSTVLFGFQLTVTVRAAFTVVHREKVTKQNKKIIKIKC